MRNVSEKGQQENERKSTWFASPRMASCQASISCSASCIMKEDWSMSRRASLALSSAFADSQRSFTSSHASTSSRGFRFTHRIYWEIKGFFRMAQSSSVGWISHGCESSSAGGTSRRGQISHFSYCRFTALCSSKRPVDFARS